MAQPSTGTWDDPRIVGRDDRHYGPLPREWGHYEGMFYHGDQTVISYRVGTTPILERPGLLMESPHPVYARRIDLGPRERPLMLQVAQLDENARASTVQSARSVLFGPETLTVVEKGSRLLEFDGSSFAQVDKADDFDMTAQDFSITARIRTKSGGSLFAKTDPGAEWVPDGKVLFVRDGQLCYDIGWVGVVESRRQVDDGRWHDIAMTWDRQDGVVTLFIDGKKDAQKVLRPAQPRSGQVVRLGFAAPDFPDPSFFEGEIELIRFFATKLSAEQVAGRGTTARPLADWDVSAGGEGVIVENLVADRYHARVSARRSDCWRAALSACGRA